MNDKIKALEHVLYPLEDYTKEQLEELDEELFHSDIPWTGALREVLSRLIVYREEYDF